MSSNSSNSLLVEAVDEEEDGVVLKAVVKVAGAVMDVEEDAGGADQVVMVDEDEVETGVVEVVDAAGVEASRTTRYLRSLGALEIRFNRQGIAITYLSIAF